MEMSENQISELIKALSTDDFINIKKSKDYVSFQVVGGYRNFEISELSMKGLTMTLNMNHILSNLYKEKTRYSQAIESNHDDIYNFDDICEKLNWQIIDFIDIISPKISPNLEMDTSIIYEISIDGLVHIMYNDQVFEGSLSVLKLFIDEPIYKILKDTKLLKLLSNE